MTKPAVEEVLRHLREEFPGATLLFTPHDNGGGDAVVDGVSIDESLEPSTTWIGAHLSPQLPFADVYPLYIGDNVKRRDGTPLGAPASPGHQF